MAAPREYSGRGFILGGVTDETPDWLGSYNEGVDAAQQQTTVKLGQQATRQRMGLDAAEEARRAQAWDWKTQDRNREEAAWGAADPNLPAPAQPDGIGLGLMPPMQLPPAQAPSPGLMAEGAAPANNGAITADQRVQMLPQWARLEQAEGLPPNFLETISMLESSGGVNTGNGQYTGIFQIGPQVAADFGVTPEQLRDPMVNAQIAAKLAGRNARQLREALGREPQPWEIYLAHQQGLGGALAVLRNPTMSAVDALTQAYGGDRSRAEQAVVQNGGNPQMTAADFAGLWAKKFGGALPQPFTGQPGVTRDTIPMMSGRGPAGVRQVEAQVGEKSDLPAGLNLGTQPAAPAPAAPPVTADAGAPAGGVGLQTSQYTPPNPSGDIVPRVTQEEAGLTQPGQGSLASQIMRTPAGQQTALPDSGLYMVEPAKIQADKFELQQARQLLEQQYAEAVRFRDRATMMEIRGKAAEIDAASRLLDNLEAIAAMQASDDNTLAQQLSRLSNGQLRLQPVTPNGTYNVYFNGKMVYENVTKPALIASLRSHFDAQYQAQVAAATERAYAREDKMLDSELKQREEITKQTADMQKLINVELTKARLRPDEYTVSVVENYVYAIPKAGGPPKVYTMEQVRDTYGNPLSVNGQPKMRLREHGTTSSVPVQ